ncbi:arginine N-succinyltransferase [Marinobacter daepoensis]|uniref:Arginine N-succinyltransferase n=1 Tax=Marinobacter daepoensis TaxID=262077 RepID=A0ABS3BGT4_9GAMM|nr:arginine N-succinyltransferase [Marinobacter daepoensis]MBN7770698.1 arginine N-succinyltransferase [Marinobacter daepoensis]MBY6034054.1 arginine N-succinyltransferase [Marinobacter daepoensis]MBY6078559.1 arginine N-succinyltransferase [Marinobacter daepoensis]
MWRVRPAKLDDLQPILNIGENRLSSTLPKTRDALARKIEQAWASLNPVQTSQSPRRFLFVLENTDTGEIAGTAGIDSRAGNGQPFYNYRRDHLVHASHELNISRRVEMLFPSHALTDLTLLCSFTLKQELRNTEVFELLSRARMMFIAGHREWFTSRTVVEIQGVQQEHGGVPFWDSLGRHFFNMDFETADQYSGQLSKTFIAELMPPNPVYVTLLSDAAQAALGQPHPLTAPNYDLLQREGFLPGCYVDIFDGGPVMEARTDTLKTLVTSQTKALHGSHQEEGDTCLISAGEGVEFRCLLTPVAETLADDVKVPVGTWRGLEKTAGDRVRISPL